CFGRLSAVHMPSLATAAEAAVSAASAIAVLFIVMFDYPRHFETAQSTPRARIRPCNAGNDWQREFNQQAVRVEPFDGLRPAYACGVSNHGLPSLQHAVHPSIPRANRNLKPRYCMGAACAKTKRAVSDRPSVFHGTETSALGEQVLDATALLAQFL